MASATPDLRLPSQPQSITALPNYTLCEQKHVCEQLAQGCYLAAHRPGVKPATSGLQDWHATVTVSSLHIHGRYTLCSKKTSPTFSTLT